MIWFEVWAKMIYDLQVWLEIWYVIWHKDFIFLSEELWFGTYIWFEISPSLPTSHRGFRLSSESVHSLLPVLQLFTCWFKYCTRLTQPCLHPSEVAKSSTSFGWGKLGKVTAAGLQVTLCVPIWHVISRSGVVIWITNCYIQFTLLYLTALSKAQVESYLCKLAFDIQ